MSDAVVPFEIAIPQADLADLRRRLARTGWPPELGENADWQDGPSLAFMQGLVAHWLDGYDWRGAEARLNVLPQFRTEIDDLPIHFVHRRGAGPAPMPLILAHGWPGSVFDLAPIIGPLADPAAHGGDPVDAFDVIAPSLPGFAFSGARRGIDVGAVGGLWAALMARLGYDRYGVQGGDLGALAAEALARHDPGRVAGLHLNAVLSVTAPDLVTDDALIYAPEEARFEQRNLAFLQNGSAWLHLTRTRPQTYAYAMRNSPVGLAAYLLDIRRMWGAAPARFEALHSRDDLITHVMLYWLTDAFESSSALVHNTRLAAARDEPAGRVAALAAILQFEDDVMLAPRGWAERRFKLQRWRLAEGGGRLASLAAPHALVDDLRAFFRPLR